MLQPKCLCICAKIENGENSDKLFGHGWKWPWVEADYNHYYTRYDRNI